MPTPSEPKPAQPQHICIIVALGIGDVNDSVLSAAIRACPKISDLPSRKVVVACIKLQPEAEKALLMSEGADREKETLLTNVMKQLRRLDLQHDGFGVASSDFPIAVRG